MLGPLGNEPLGFSDPVVKVGAAGPDQAVGVRDQNVTGFRRPTFNS